MARASFWNIEEHPVQDLLYEVLGTYASEQDDFEELFKEAGLPEGAELAFLTLVEEMYSTELPDDVVEDLYMGASMCDLFEVLDDLPKVAAITSMVDRARASVYRSAHREEIKRKAKKRRKLQAKGLKQKMRRIGTSASGFIFVADSRGNQAGGSAAVGGLRRSFDFRPDKNVDHHETSRLRWK